MTNNNGTVNAETLTAARQRLRQARIETKLLESRVQLQELTRTQHLLEAITASDVWVGLFNDRLERFRTDPNVFSTTNLHDRRHGRNIPLFQTESELAMLRMQSRILCASNGYAIGLLEGLTSYMIGPGYTYRVVAKRGQEPTPQTLAAVQNVINQFQEINEWYGGEQQPLEAEFFQRSVEDGEAIWNHYQEDELTYVRTVEPEQLTQQPGTDYQECGWGVRTRRDDAQRPLGYWIYYGDGPQTGEEYDPKQVTHFRRNVKRSIKRGMPDFSFDTAESFQIASKLRRNMALGAAIQSSYAGIRQHEQASKTQIESMQTMLANYQRVDATTGRMQSHQRNEPGMVDIPKGMSFVLPPSATNAAAHVEILRALLEGAGQRWNAPTWLSNSSASDMGAYKASLVAESPFVRKIVREQRPYGETFKRSMWLAVENYANTRGIDGKTWEEVRQLIDIQVEPPSVETHDKLQEAGVLDIERRNGVTSVQTWQQIVGRDPDEEQTNQEEWDERHGAAGQGLGLPGSEDDATAQDAKSGGGLDTPGGTGDSGLRATVGGLNAIAALQADYYAGKLPRGAAIANVRMLFAFSPAEAAALFPETVPVKLSPDNAPSPDGSNPVSESNEDGTGTRAARNAVLAALKDGTLKKTKCKDCGAAEVEAHHDDYTKPLKVTWLCRECHDKRHGKDVED